MCMRGNKPVEWKKKFLNCKDIKYKEKIIPLAELLGKEHAKKDNEQGIRTQVIRRR